MTFAAIILIIVALIIFLAVRKEKERSIARISDLQVRFKPTTVLEIKGIDLIPLHISNLEKAFAHGDMNIVNTSYAKIIEIVRQKNVDEKGSFEEILKSLRDEYEQFRQTYNLQYPAQFLPPSERKDKISYPPTYLYLDAPNYDELPKSLIEHIDVVRTLEQWNQLSFHPKRDKFSQWNDIKREGKYFLFQEIENPTQRHKLSIATGKKITKNPYNIKALIAQGFSLDDFVDNLEDLPLFFSALENIEKKDFAQSLEPLQKAIQKRPLPEYKKLKEYVEIKLGNIDTVERMFKEYEFDIDNAIHVGEIYDWLKALLKNKKYDMAKIYIQQTDVILDGLAKGEIKPRIYGLQNSDWYSFKKEDFHKHLDKIFDSNLHQLEKSDDAITLLELYLSLYTGKNIRAIEQIATLYSSWDLKEKAIDLYKQCIVRFASKERPEVSARINKKLAELT